jgi:hypothetical protein
MPYRTYPSPRQNRQETPDDRRRRWAREAEVDRRADLQREAREAAQQEAIQAYLQAEWDALSPEEQADQTRREEDRLNLAAGRINPEPAWARQQRLKREERDRQSRAFAEAYYLESKSDDQVS